MFRGLRKYALFIAFIIFTAFQAEAMPPHPGNTNPSGRERPPAPLEGDTPLYQSLMRSSAASRVSSSAPATGTVRVLVLLIEYSSSTSDPQLPYQMDGDSTPVYYDNLLENNAGLTMKQYYSDMSKESLNLSFDVYGPYSAANSLEYYGQNLSNGYDRYPATLVAEAVNAADADVNYSDYDNDGNGNVDTVIIIHAGPGEEFGADDNTIWSHNWTLSSAASSGDGPGAVPHDGVTINNYTIQPEYNDSPGDSTIGVFCHEFGHVLGLPDLYDTYNETRGVGVWSLMSGGSWTGNIDVNGDGYGDPGSAPAPLLAWERDWIGGSDWITITDIAADITGNSIDDIESSFTAYKISLGTSGQYLILEGKKKVTSSSGWYVPESGILITQIDENIISKYMGSNTINAGYDYVHGVNVIEAESDYYDNEGRGSLWNRLNPQYGTMSFSAATRNYLSPSSSKTLGTLPLFWQKPITGIAAFTLLISLLTIFSILKIKKQGQPVLAYLFFLIFFPFIFSILSCPDSSSDSISYKLVDHPNSNYYKSEDISSKIGISGVTISNISSNSFPMTFDLDVP